MGAGMTTCSVPDCTSPIGLPCHTCGVPLCWAHGHTFLLVIHCADCWDRDHARQASAQQQATMPRAAVASRPRPQPLAVGDVCLLPGGQYLLVVDVWRAEPPVELGRVTCLLGATWTPPATFVAVKPHQSALFGFTSARDLPFERVGGIEPDVARQIHRDGQTLLAAASGSGGAT